MSKVLNTNTSYDIINRKELLADSNTSAIGSLNTAISNPVQKPDAAYILSRVGNAGNTDRKPTPGYCLHFDSTNVISVDSIYIQTNIPSVERSNYNIVIKGEGAIDLLQVDTSDTNIRIVPKQAITDSAYFDLSYIAFRNITTGKIDHLFEYEESSGTLLYDAVTGDTATITSSSGSIVSLTTLRGVTSYKEWIIDEDENLKNSIKCNSTYGQIATLKTVPAELSLCVTIQMTQEEYDPIGSINILGMINGTSYFCLSKRPEIYWMPGFTWSYKNANLAEESGFEVKSGYYNKVMSTILDGKPHKLVCCIGNRTKDGTTVESYSDKGLKFFLDGVAVSDNIGGRNKQFLNTPTEFNAMNTFGIGTSTNYPLAGGGIISNIKYFNFDISESGAPYTLEDYQNDKDVPEQFLTGRATTDPNMGSTTVVGSETGWVETIGTTTSVTKTVGDWTAMISTTGVGYIKSGSYTDGNNVTVDNAVLINTYGNSGTTSSLQYFWNNKTDFLVYKGKTIKVRISGKICRIQQTFVPEVGMPTVKFVAFDSSFGSIPELNTWTDFDKIVEVAIPDTLTTDKSKFCIFAGYRTDMSAPSCAFANIKAEVLGEVLEFNNFSKSNGVWLDSSANNWNMTFTGTYDLPNKNYGTWCNGVGYNNTTYLLGPDNITDVPSMPYQAWDNNQFTGTPTVSGNSITYTKTGADVANFYYTVLYLGWDNTSANFRWRGKRLHFEFDNVSYNFANGIRDITEVWLKIQYTNSDGTGQILLLKQAYSGGFLSFNAEIPADCLCVNAVNILIFCDSKNTITITAGDTNTYTNPKCWVEDFENVSIEASTVNTFTSPKIPRKLLN